ncbi:MAG: acyltransferase [Hyphomonadaceae bacterium]
MNRGFSLYLDFARVSAAIVVLFSHFAYPWASGGGLLWIRELNLGSDAVVLFFVLSGLVIAHTTTVKDRSIGSYALARASRLYSVAIPALVLSLVCAGLVQRINPGQYPDFDAVSAAAQIVRGLTFTNYIWWDSQRIVANGPYWSVSYEFWYYALFGAAFFLRGSARIWVPALIALFIGPKILLLAPCWLTGVYVYRRLQGGLAERITAGRGWRMALGPAVAYAALLAMNAPLKLKVLTWEMTGHVHPGVLFSFSDEFIWNFVLAILCAIHFIGVAAIVRNGSRPLEAGAKAIRWISGRTFSLYLCHMPLLKLGSNLPGYRSENPLHAAALLVGAVAICLVIAEFTERRLPVWRDMIGGVADGIARLVRQRRRPRADVKSELQI